MLGPSGRVTAEPDQLAVMMYLFAGACEEQRALDEELRYTRAIKQQNPDEAEDALIAQKRHLVNAAKRQYLVLAATGGPLWRAGRRGMPQAGYRVTSLSGWRVCFPVCKP